MRFRFTAVLALALLLFTACDRDPVRPAPTAPTCACPDSCETDD